MYCKKETLELAISKGFKQCSCSAGGYPNCECDKENIRFPVRLDDIVRWLYDKKEILVNIYPDYLPYDWIPIKIFAYEVTKFDTNYARSCDEYPYESPDSAFEEGILHALTLI